MPNAKFVWIIATALGLSLSFTTAHAQLNVNDREQEAFVSFAGGESKTVAVPPNLKFDFKFTFDFAPSVRPGLVPDQVAGPAVEFRASLPAVFSEELARKSAESSDAPFQFLPGDSLRIPEPSAYGFIGVLVLFGLTALHHIRRKSAGLAA